MQLSLLALSLLALASGPASAVPQVEDALKIDFGAMFDAHPQRGRSVPDKQGVMFMNRIGPSTSELYIANADGTNERKLLGANSSFDYHPTISHDGKWITFTSERNGDGNSDIYRVQSDGTGLEKLVATSSFEDAASISPNGNYLAYVSTANGYKANIWVMDLKTGVQRNLTNTAATVGVSTSPDGHFRPSWSPDSNWITFSSDRNTQWRGHGNGTGWEHTQELSVYVIKYDGTGFRQLATKSGYCLGSPKFSPDGKRIVYYELTVEDTWGAHRPEDINSVTSQIVSVDFATGTDRIEHTSQSGLKLSPQYVASDAIGYLMKGAGEGLNYTAYKPGRAEVLGPYRSPSWSNDGQLVVYEKVGWTIRPMEKTLYSWDNDWEYRFTDVFPQLSRQGVLAMTQKQLGNSSIVKLNPDGSNLQLVFDVFSTGQLDPTLVAEGLSGAFQPTWSADGQWIAFGLGSWFQERGVFQGWIYRAKADGSSFEQLTDGTINSGFPSYSLDGRYLVYRVWGAEFGLRIMDLTDKSVRVLTTEWDNLPFYSPDGNTILFTRKMNATNYDVCTISPDGTNLQVLTSSGANDAHAVWTADGRILYSSGANGFRDEAANYDDTFQPYGQIFSMNADGSNKTMLTDSMWEDSMPLYVPNQYLN